jgi:hypothetical protein
VSVSLHDLAVIADPLIKAGLEHVQEAGWEALVPFDALSLMYEGRLSWRERNTWWSDTSTYALISATVRLRRMSTAAVRA